MALYRFRINGGISGVVNSPTQEMARVKVCHAANERAWFEAELEPADIEIEGILFEHVTLFGPEQTIGY